MKTPIKQYTHGKEMKESVLSTWRVDKRAFGGLMFVWRRGPSEGVSESAVQVQIEIKACERDEVPTSNHSNLE